MSSKIECFGRVNGVDYFPNSIKVYIGTNINVDILLQSLFWIFILFLIPKNESTNFKYSHSFPIFIVTILVYIHLIGENMFYKSFAKEFNVGIKYDNFFLFSILLMIAFLIYIFSDLLKFRFNNLINYFPFIFLLNGSYNSLNLNFYVLLVSFIGIHSLMEKKFNKRFTIIYLIFSSIQIITHNTKNIFFDIDKLKGFTNSSQNISSLIYWIIIFYLFIIGIHYIINETKHHININKLKSNFLISGGLITIVGVASASNPFINFYSYYYLGLNKMGIKSLRSVEGNTWRGISSSAEGLGEFLAFSILFSLLIIYSKKLSFNRLDIFLIILNFYGLFKSNNFAATSSLILFLIIYMFLNWDVSKRNKLFIFLFISIISLTFVALSNFNYESASRSLIREGLKASEIDVVLPGDQNQKDAVDNLNFGEILSYKKEETNLSSSLYLLTERYTNSKDIKLIPNPVGVINAISLPINRSEKWGIFFAKYNPDFISFLFGSGPQQLTDYYLGHRTKVNTGLVLPHSSLLDYLVFYGFLGLICCSVFIFHKLYKNRNNYLYVSLLLFIIINLLKSDSMLYVSSFILFIFILNLNKIGIKDSHG